MENPTIEYLLHLEQTRAQASHAYRRRSREELEATLIQPGPTLGGISAVIGQAHLPPISMSLGGMVVDTATGKAITAKKKKAV